MLHMSGYCTTESLLSTLHEVITTATMHVYVNTSRHHIHTLCINHFGTHYCEVAIGYR